MNGETLAASEQVKKSKADHLRLNARELNAGCLI